jgi:hypothetical protein
MLPPKLNWLSGFDWLHVHGLQALLPLLDGKFDFLAFVQCLEARRLDRRIVHKHIVGAVARDKPIAFGFVEPLDFSDLSLTHVVSFLSFFLLLLRSPEAKTDSVP